MKPLFLTLTIFSLLLLAALGCTPKNEPRWVQESKKEWTPSKTESDDSVPDAAFANYDLQANYALLNDPHTDLVKSILKPLAAIVLNRKFIETPRFRTTRMTQMLHLFNTAMQTQLEKGDSSSDFQTIKTQFKEAVFSGCSRDLRRDCINAEFFAGDTRNMRILTLLAREYDPQIEKLLLHYKDAPPKEQSPSLKCLSMNGDCRSFIEERYRLLTMAAFNKRSRNADRNLPLPI